MQAIRQWLEGLGLAQYAATFEANDVGLDILPALTEEDLQRLGVSLGDRKRILLALPTSRSKAGIADPPIESLTAQGERRQVTVLFCDLVGSTALSSTHDPEEYRAILARYHETSIAEIQRFEGFVAQIQGDGVVAYFGYPLAHENEADRAVRAGLRIVESIREATLEQPLHVRIGIASGLVVVSHILAPEKSAVGETPNLAARLQTIALPGEVLVGDRTRLLAGWAFEYEERGTHILKGIPGPTRVWKVVGPSRGTSRFEAATRGSVLPMIGREQELGLMLDRWENSRSGRGQVVLLQGEPGIGKSRLLQAFRERVAGRMEMTLQYHCSPYHTNSAFYPIADHLERALAFGREETAEQKFDRIERYLLGFQSLRRASNSGRGNKDYIPGKTECSLLARVLGITCDERYTSMTMSPQRQKDDTINLLVDLVATIATRQATSVIFEDLHWADPTTLEVLGSLIERTEKLPLLILTTFRPEFAPRWKRGPHITHIGLARLSRAQSANIVLRVTGSKPLASDLISQIVDKTDGVPLYVEELTKAVLESSVVVDRGDRYDYSGAGKMGIPATLRDSLMARLDRLVPVKEIAQMGACLGREFSYELVRAISPMSKAQLDEALEKLTASELVFRRGRPPDAVYFFKHALVQDAAYDSLLKTRRQALHAEIARNLEERFPAICDTRPELLAHHFTAAEMPEQAVHYWKRAGEQAHTRIALQEAIAHLERGLAVAMTLPPSQVRDRHVLELRGQLGMAWIALQGWAYPAVGEHLEPAYALEEALTPGRHSLRVLWGLWVYVLALAQTRRSLPIAEKLLSQGEGSGDEEMRLAGLWALVTTHYWLGEFDKCVAYADMILEAYDLVRHRSLADVTNHDPKTVALQYKSAALGLLGHPERAAITMTATLEHARVRGHAFDHAWALFFAMYQLHNVQLDAKGMDSLLEEFERLVRDQRLLAFEHVMGPFCRASRDLINGLAESADRSLDDLIPKLESAGLNMVVAEANIAQARCAILLQEPDRALTLVEKAIAIVTQPGGDSCYLLAEALRIRGETFAALGKAAEAEVEFGSAIELARMQKAKWWELRATISLAGLLKDQNRFKEAREALLPIYLWFHEGHDCKDLREAANLLANLGYSAPTSETS